MSAPVLARHATQALPTLRETRGIRSWWTRNILGTDPAPCYSRLDRLDGLDTRRGVI